MPASSATDPAFSTPITDPLHDGAADPVLIWNRDERTWWCVFCQVRANTRVTEPSWTGRFHGTGLAAASSSDRGRSWLYRGALDLAVEPGHNTYWGPEVIGHDGGYHMFVTFIRGVPNDPRWDTHGTPSVWTRQIHHLTSRDLWSWEHQSRLDLGSDHVVDPCVARLPEGGWGMWYKDEGHDNQISLARSDDLVTWEPAGVALSGWHEGPVVFELGGKHWLLSENKDYRAHVYRSDDAHTWEAQGELMPEPGARPHDASKPRQPDVVPLSDDRAIVVYYTQTGADSFGSPGPPAPQASVCQLAELRVEGGTLTCDRDAPFEPLPAEGWEP